ncbi:MAG TPA: GspE/PulE family protein, partial [Rhodocyclaceae bacterium]|nr:GspE/PulE family protein [Rhodocyclaceae bacterium]
MARPEKIRLGDLLIQQGLLTDEQLKLSLDEQKRTGRKLGRIFVESGYVTEEGISKALARQLQAPYIDLRTYQLNNEVMLRLPEAQARRFRAVVLEDRGNTLLVGLSDPTDLTAYDDLARVLKRDIDIAVVTESQVLAAIDRTYRKTEEIAGLAKELTTELGDVPVEFGELLGLSSGQDEAPVVKLLQTVFEEALRLRASDIHVEPQQKNLRIRFRIDGLLHVQTEADQKIAGAVSLRLKLMSGLDISEKRLPQDGRFVIHLKSAQVDVRISTMPTQYGESIVMRLLNQNTGLLRLDGMNMPKRILDKLRDAIHRPSGMVLVTGPTGSGKTTTLYAALNELNGTDKKIITVEDPVEYRLAGLNQVQVHEKIDLTFSRVLRTALRQDPDIVLVGEMRDQETAEIGMRAAMTGHMVLSTLHTNDALSTPIRLLDMGIPQ